MYHPKLTKIKLKENSSNLTFLITDSNKINQITLKILCCKVSFLEEKFKLSTGNALHRKTNQIIKFDNTNNLFYRSF